MILFVFSAYLFAMLQINCGLEIWQGPLEGTVTISVTVAVLGTQVKNLFLRWRI